jgi:hypothetical protein
MIDTVKVNGGNNCKVPFMKRDALFRQGNLPRTLEIPLNIVNRAKAK